MVIQVIGWQYRKKVVSWLLSMDGRKSPKIARKSILITIKTPNNHFYLLVWENKVFCRIKRDHRYIRVEC